MPLVGASSPLIIVTFFPSPTTSQLKPMINFNYTVALYRFAYGVVSMSEQDNIRYSYGECLDCNIGIDIFYNNVNRALCAV